MLPLDARCFDFLGFRAYRPLLEVVGGSLRIDRLTTYQLLDQRDEFRAPLAWDPIDLSLHATVWKNPQLDLSVRHRLSQKSMDRPPRLAMIASGAREGSLGGGAASEIA